MEIPGDENVLVRDRHAGQRRRVAFADACVSGARLRQRDFRTHVQKGVEVPVAFDAPEENPRKLDGGNLLRNQRVAQLGHRLFEHRAAPTR